MENIGEEQTRIGEQELLPSVIKKEKTPQKRRETQSPAQLGTLKRGRERETRSEKTEATRS